MIFSMRVAFPAVDDTWNNWSRVSETRSGRGGANGFRRRVMDNANYDPCPSTLDRFRSGETF